MKRIAALLILLSLSIPAFADNWPAWRGPTGQGYCMEKNLLLKWSAKDNVKWKIKLDHPGYSTPIVWGDKVFVTLGTPNGEVRSLYCFSRTDGKQLWKNDVPFDGKEQRWGKYPYCHASPVTDGQRVVVSFGSAGVYGYDLAGKELWKRTDLGEWQHQFGNASSPIIYGDICIQWCGPNGKKGRNFLLAVDKKTGKTVWDKDEKDGSWGTPIIVNIGGQDQLLLGFGPQLKAYAPKTGEEIWHCKGLTSYVYTSPLYKDGYAVAMSGYGGAGIGIKVGGTGDITKNGQLWRHPRNNQRVGSGIILGEHVYILEDNGQPRCYELKTGKEVWQADKGPIGRNWGSLVHADGRFYCLANDGSTVVFKASPQYEVLAINRLGQGESTNSSIVISNGDFFLRTNRHLWCIGEKK
ncbi:MAG: PQQ-binding-like beta-propeller repeat protein [Planctomycetes bacterium]|nr:PQQ-binding-like beta-propeller repeat protein [Planctomycetota bacterium]